MEFERVFIHNSKDMAKQNTARPSRKRLYWVLAILACAGSFGLGWLLNKATTVINIPPPLRLDGISVHQSSRQL